MMLANAQPIAAQAQQDYIQGINNITRMQIDLGQQMREGANRRIAQKDLLQYTLETVLECEAVMLHGQKAR